MANETSKGQLCCHKHLSLRWKTGHAVLASSLFKWTSTFPLQSPTPCSQHHSHSPFPLHAGTHTSRKCSPTPQLWLAQLRYLSGRWFILRNGISTCFFLKCGGREGISPWYYRVLVVWRVPTAGTGATCQHHLPWRHCAFSALCIQAIHFSLPWQIFLFI